MNKRGSSVDIRNKFPALLQFLQDQRKIIEYEYSELRYSTNEINKQRIHMFNEEAKIYNTDFPLHEQTVNEPKHVNLLNSTNFDCQDRLDNCILPIMNIYCTGKFINVLWDTISLITNKVARELGLTKGTQRTLTVIKVGGTVEEIESSSYMVPLVDKRSKKVHIHGVDTISSNINNVDISNTINLFNNLHKEEILNPQGSVDMLIGMNYASIQPQREQTIDNLILYGNRFGKCIVGSHHTLEGQNIAKVNLCQIKSEQTSVLERFFTIEQMGVSCIPQCGIQSTERNLTKDPAKAIIYKKLINAMIERRVARKLTNAEILEYKGPVYYLPYCY